jgi:hypothetical protein
MSRKKRRSSKKGKKHFRKKIAPGKSMLVSSEDFSAPSQSEAEAQPELASAIQPLEEAAAPMHFAAAEPAPAEFARENEPRAEKTEEQPPTPARPHRWSRRASWALPVASGADARDSAALKVLAFFALCLACLGLGWSLTLSPDVSLGVFVSGVAALVCYIFLLTEQYDRQFLIRVFLLALVLRWLVGYAIYYNNQYNDLGIGPDWWTYNHFGHLLLRTWQGEPIPHGDLDEGKSGWGMFYYVAALYALTGKNPLSLQMVNCALGAMICVIIYKIAYLVYPHQRVARGASLLAALSPSLILWTSQGIKEGPIIFCLCLCTLYTIRLCRKFELSSLAMLLLALFGLYTLRHYVSLVILFAIVGAWVVAVKKLTPVQAVRSFVLVVIVAMSFAYFGGELVASTEIDLKQIQRGRAWSARVSESGFGGDYDISKPDEAVAFLPIGMLYVLFSPFPWMVRGFGQMIILPETLLWWLAFPLMARGYWFALRRLMPASFTLCIFPLIITVLYALTQTNVGTLYRQRAQIMVFFCVFISLGWELRRQAKLNRQAHTANQRVFVPLVPVRS